MFTQLKSYYFSQQEKHKKARQAELELSLKPFHAFIEKLQKFDKEVLKNYKTQDSFATEIYDDRDYVRKIEELNKALEGFIAESKRITFEPAKLAIEKYREKLLICKNNSVKLISQLSMGNVNCYKKYAVPLVNEFWNFKHAMEVAELTMKGKYATKTTDLENNNDVDEKKPLLDSNCNNSLPVLKLEDLPPEALIAISHFLTAKEIGKFALTSSIVFKVMNYSDAPIKTTAIIIEKENIRKKVQGSYQQIRQWHQNIQEKNKKYNELELKWATNPNRAMELTRVKDKMTPEEQKIISTNSNKACLALTSCSCGMVCGTVCIGLCATNAANPLGIAALVIGSVCEAVGLTGAGFMLFNRYQEKKVISELSALRKDILSTPISPQMTKNNM